MVAAGVAHAQPSATAAKKCKAPKYPGSGSITSMSVTKTTCTTGKKVVLAFQKCRTKKGPTARCVKKVLGYACQEVRTNGPTQISGSVTCGKGKRRVKHKYTANIAGPGSG